MTPWFRTETKKFQAALQSCKFISAPKDTINCGDVHKHPISKREGIDPTGTPKRQYLQVDVGSVVTGASGYSTAEGIYIGQPTSGLPDWSTELNEAISRLSGNT